MEHIAWNMKHIQKSILDALFPIFCIRCEAYREALCDNCRLTIPYSLHIASGPGSSIFLSAHEYRHPLVNRLVSMLKYQGYRDCAPVLVKPLYWIWQQRLAVHENYVITCIPLHCKKERARGFNQSELLARELAQQINLPFHNLLLRTRNTTTQVSLTKDKRAENMKGVFVAVSPMSINEKNIILVDDVFTTGSTMYEASRALLAAGAKQIFGITVARG